MERISVVSVSSRTNKNMEPYLVVKDPMNRSLMVKDPNLFSVINGSLVVDAEILTEPGKGKAVFYTIVSASQVTAGIPAVGPGKSDYTPGGGSYSSGGGGDSTAKKELPPDWGRSEKDIIIARQNAMRWGTGMAIAALEKDMLPNASKGVGTALFNFAKKIADEAMEFYFSPTDNIPRNGYTGGVAPVTPPAQEEVLAGGYGEEADIPF